MDTISFNQFEQIDIRIGTVVAADIPEWSHWVMRIKVYLGEELGTKTAFSGIMKFYKPEELIGKQFPFVVNLKPKTIGPDKELSEIMMIMATPEPQALPMAMPRDDEETPPVLFQLQSEVANGTKVR